MHPVFSFAAFGSLTAGTAILGSIATQSSVDTWYAGLDKPSFTPPRVAFPIAWTGLYCLIAWSGHRVWRAPPSRGRTVALALWGTQLALNAAWSPLFFGLRRPGAALVDIVALGAAIVGYGIAAARVDRKAGAMMVPYAGWVGFATALNAAIWRRN
jgi:benzodiazapine receptor